MVDELIVPERTELSDAVMELAGIVLTGQTLDVVLGQLAEVVKRAVPGAYEVSITMEGRDPLTAASTSDFTVKVDAAQYEAGYGPCLDALRFGTTVVVDNQLTDDRWPAYSPGAIEAGVRSSVSVPLTVDDRRIAALNIYGIETKAFDEESVQVAEDLSVYAGVVLNNATLYVDAQSRADQMLQAMATRAVIEQAKGILMGARRCGADEAFAILVRLSQQSGRKLRDVAVALVEQTTSD